MPIDDKVEKALDSLSRESQINVAGEVLRAAIAGIPFAGSPITSLLEGGYRRFILERAVDVFKAMKEGLEKLDESKINREFFESEEFQVLVALALDQLQTTKDKVKLRMLACGLANSGLVEFSSETRKELFLRILRDLSPNHIQVLRQLAPRSQALLKMRMRLPFARPRGEDLAILQNLAAHGLAEEFFTVDKRLSGPRYGSQWTESDIQRALQEYLKEVLEREFRITDFGIDFLNYFEQEGSLVEEGH